MKNKGFTLIELMVVVIIIAVLAMFAFSYYRKAQQDSEYDRARLVLQEIGSGYERMQLEQPGTDLHPGGAITSNTVGGTCDRTGDVTNLMSCGYLERKAWDNFNYNFYLLGTSGSAGGKPAVASMTAKSSAAGSKYGSGTIAAIYQPGTGVCDVQKPNEPAPSATCN